MERSTARFVRLKQTLVLPIVVALAFGFKGTARPAIALPLGAPQARGATALGRQLSSADETFIAQLLKDAAAQLDLARFVAQHGTSSGMRSAGSAQEMMWDAVSARLRGLAATLHIALPSSAPAAAPSASPGADGSVLDRLVRGNRAVLDRMVRIDPAIASRLLFFVDETLPQIELAQRALQFHRTL